MMNGGEVKNEMREALNEGRCGIWECESYAYYGIFVCDRVRIDPLAVVEVKWKRSTIKSSGFLHIYEASF